MIYLRESRPPKKYKSQRRELSQTQLQLQPQPKKQSHKQTQTQMESLAKKKPHCHECPICWMSYEIATHGQECVACENYICKRCIRRLGNKKCPTCKQEVGFRPVGRFHKLVLTGDEDFLPTNLSSCNSKKLEDQLADLQALHVERNKDYESLEKSNGQLIEDLIGQNASLSQRLKEAEEKLEGQVTEQKLLEESLRAQILALEEEVKPSRFGRRNEFEESKDELVSIRTPAHLRSRARISYSRTERRELMQTSFSSVSGQVIPDLEQVMKKASQVREPRTVKKEGFPAHKFLKTNSLKRNDQVKEAHENILAISPLKKRKLPPRPRNKLPELVPESAVNSESKMNFLAFNYGRNSQSGRRLDQT